MKDSEDRTSIQRSFPIVNITLFLWMMAVFLLHLILFTPPVILTIAEQLNLQELLNNLQEQIKPFFQTTDFSIYMNNRF